VQTFDFGVKEGKNNAMIKWLKKTAGIKTIRIKVRNKKSRLDGLKKVFE
jgi:hypothetical protein